MTKYNDMGGMDAASRIKKERCRQIELEGWTPEHDDEHSSGELALASMCYTRQALSVPYLDNIDLYRSAPPPIGWPWEASWWKPKNPQRDLIRAGALIAAEVDRIERDIAERGSKDYPDWTEPSR